ncbi:helix-turn-helix domain-containing protein [Propioniciclava soli]|uniref:helix-turn-helix domain-containing protein n=1 Tax=Propioniciclava soli TaxID=2775081 RepID=UPI001E5237BE|nr:helix-turn-helix transcriptional regulator [Propioniciclava soli]
MPTSLFGAACWACQRRWSPSARGISVSTLSRLENGDTGVGLATFLNVAGALGIRDAVVQATDPFETDFGRARAELALPKLVRR